MALQEYIDKKGIKANWLNNQLGWKDQRIYALTKNERLITLAEACQLEQFTNGELKPMDFVTNKIQVNNKKG